VTSESEKKRVDAAHRAAVAKWKDRRIAVCWGLGDGLWTIKALTGRWTLDTSVSPPFAREASVVYWVGKSLEEAEREVGLRK
jgi:hypothetical protein